MKLVIIESPYAGNVERNVAYARACVADSLSRGDRFMISDILLAAIALTVLVTAAWGLINAARIGVLVVERDHWRRTAVWWQQQAGESAEELMRLRRGGGL